MTEDSFKQLVVLMQAQSDLIHKLLENQEKFEAEQAKCGKAIGEAGMILLDHAQNLRNLGAATTRLWIEAGLPVNEQPKTVN